MAKQLQLRRGTTAQHSTFTGAAGEVTVDTDKDVVVVHDGSTAGGKAMVKEADTAYTIATVNDFGTVPVGYTTVIVKDTDRGGVFNRIASTTANGGTIFSGTTGYSWERQYSGAVNVKWFGANETRLDNEIPIQAAIDNFRVVYIPVGIYLTSSEIIMRNLTKLIGENGYWSSGIQTVLQRTGSNTSPILRASSTPIGTVSNSAISAIQIKDIKLDGNNIADICLFINYASNESRFENITVVNAKFGIVAAKLWYVSFRDITAKSCSVIGMLFGENYLSSYNGTEINGVSFLNIRSQACGSRYNASTNPYGFGASNLTASGIVMKLGYGNSVKQITSETNYGSGLFINGLTNNSYSDLYFEGNCALAVADGEVPSPYCMVCKPSASSGIVEIANIYSHSSNNNVYIDDSIVGSSFLFRDAIRLNFVSYTNTGSSYKVEYKYASSLHSPANNNKVGQKIKAIYGGYESLGSGSATPNNSNVELITMPRQENWVSGTTLTLGTIELNPTGQARTSFANILFSVGVQTYTQAGGNDSYSKLYTISAICSQRLSTLTTGEVTVTITEISSARENSNTYLGGISLTSSVSVAGTTATILLQMSPTSTGGQEYNCIVSSGIMLGGGLRLGKIPSLT